MLQKPNRLPTALIIVALIATMGCDNSATHIAREAADRQAQQNTTMAELNKEVAAGSHQLVEADAQARKEIVGVHRDLQAERSRLDTNWNTLEEERRDLAGQRRTESMLASMTQMIGVVALTAMLLGFCWYLLVAARRDDIIPELSDLLIQDLLTDAPLTELGAFPALLSRVEQSLEQEGTTSPSP